MMRTGRQINLAVIALLFVVAVWYFHSSWTTREEAVGNPKDAADRPSYYEAKENEEELIDKHAVNTHEKTQDWKQVVLDGIKSSAKLAKPAAESTSAGKVESTKPHSSRPSVAFATSPPLIPYPDPAKITPTYDRVLVMGKLQSEDTEWVRRKLPDWQHAVIKTDNPSSGHMHTLVNRGREALPYLTYLVEHYDNLPATIVFIHSHQKAWHNEGRDRDAVFMLRTLNIETIQRNGFVNLRCETSPGCPDRIQPSRGNSTVEREMAGAWRELFGGSRVPEVLAAPCCGQFAVSRSQVLKRPLGDYKKYLDWLLRTPLDDDTSGGLFEYLWHVIFGRGPVHCPDTKQCYCDLYRQCATLTEFGSVRDED